MAPASVVPVLEFFNFDSGGHIVIEALGDIQIHALPTVGQAQLHEDVVTLLPATSYPPILSLAGGDLGVGASLSLSPVSAVVLRSVALGSVSAPNRPAHQPGDTIIVSEAASPVTGPVGGTVRVDALTVEIGAGATVTGGPVPRTVSWWGTVTDTIGVRTGAGSTVFNAGTIQAGTTVQPSGPAPAADSIRPLADYTAILDEPPFDGSLPVFDAAASRASALATAAAAQQTVGTATTAARDLLTTLQQRTEAAAAARPEPWIDPRQVDITGPSDPSGSWSGHFGLGSFLDGGSWSFVLTDSTDTIAIDATDDSTIVNAGRIASDKDGIVAGSDNRIVNTGTIDAGRDGITAQHGNAIANTGTINAGRDGIAADDDNVVLNTGAISAGGDGIAADARTLVTNSGTIAGGANGVSLGSDGGVLNTGAISAGDDGIAAGNDSVVTNSGTIAGGTGGVSLGSDGAVLNTETGTIAGGISAGGDVVIDNRGTLSGAIRASGGVVTNAGTVIGGIDLENYNDIVVNDGTVTGRVGAGVIVNTGQIGGTDLGSRSVLNTGDSTGDLYGTQVLNTGSVTSVGDGMDGVTLINEGHVDAGFWGLQIDGGGIAHNTGTVLAGSTGVLAFDTAGVGFVNSGTLTTGSVGQGRAIDFSESRGDNTVALLTGSDLTGSVAGGRGQDTLILDGSGAEDANIAAFERVAMIGDDWSLSGNVEAAEVLAASGSLMLGGAVTGDVYVYEDATLTGGGVIAGVLVAAGTVEAGDGIGDFVIDGDAVFNADSRLVIDVGGAEDGLFDAFTTTDDIFFDGILEFVFSEDAALDLDDVLIGVLGYDGLLVGPNSEIVWSGLPDGWYLIPTLGADAVDFAFGFDPIVERGARLEIARAGNIDIVPLQVPVPASALLLGLGLAGLACVRRAGQAAR